MKKAKSHNSKHRTKLHCIAESAVEMFIKQKNEQTIQEQIQKNTTLFMAVDKKKSACDWCPLVVELFVGLCTHSLWSHLSPKSYYHSEVESVNDQYTLPPQGENEEKKREQAREREKGHCDLNTISTGRVVPYKALALCPV